MNKDKIYKAIADEINLPKDSVCTFLRVVLRDKGKSELSLTIEIDGDEQDENDLKVMEND